MIAARLQPEVEVDGRYGWALIFYVGNSFNGATPFRAILAEMVSVLSQHAKVDLQLPAHEHGEDFIDGQLRFGTHTMGVYFEHSLGYISLHGSDRTPLDEVWTILRGMVVVDEQSPGLAR